MQQSELPKREIAQADVPRGAPPALAGELEEMRATLAARGADIETLRRERSLAQQALEQQASQLAAALTTVRRQAERQAELRSLLLDAHEQLALRDELVAGRTPRERVAMAMTARARSWRSRLKSRLGLLRL